MKKILSVLVAILLVTVMCVPAFAADTITIVPSATEAAVGDEITVSFNVAEGLTGVDAVLKYDTQYLELVKDSAVATDLMTTELNTANDGEIHVASAKNDPAEAGTLFTAKFKVKKVNAVISAEANEILDSSDTDIAPGTTIASVTIGEKAADETTTAASDNNGGSGNGSGNNGGSGNGSGNNGGSGNGSNSKNPKTGNTPVVGAAAVVLAASAAVIVSMKKKNED